MYRYNVEKVTSVPNPATKAKEQKQDFAKAHVQARPSDSLVGYTSGPVDNFNANYPYVNKGNVSGNFQPKTSYQYNQFVGPKNLFVPYSQTG